MLTTLSCMIMCVGIVPKIMCVVYFFFEKMHATVDSQLMFGRPIAVVTSVG